MLIPFPFVGLCCVDIRIDELIHATDFLFLEIPYQFEALNVFSGVLYDFECKSVIIFECLLYPELKWAS